jgi:mono/diheme cytochrome c family protein
LRARFRRPPRRASRLAFAATAAAAGLAAAGCGAVGIVKSGNAATGKTLFKQNCASCHTLKDAGASGAIGPNLDAVFGVDKKQGFNEQTIRDLVRGQIALADPNTGTGHPGMPSNILRGQQAKDVAVYVAKCAGVTNCDVGSG